MPINPTAGLIFASIDGATLTLICTLFVQGCGVIAGLMCANIFASTWRG